MENQPFVLVELEDLSSIFAPLKTASRIKYTCFNVSSSYLIFGATSGSLYVFRREPCCFLQLLPNKEGSITNVAISPDEKFIGFSTVKGTVCIVERSSHGAKQIVTTSEHQNEQITYLKWNERNDELFVGDNTGKVSVVSLSIFPTKSMFQTPSFVLMQLDSKIVQMDFNSNMLLVSTETKCCICDTTREVFRQVGHKLRYGDFGACIFNTDIDRNNLSKSAKSETEINPDYSNLSHLKLLCARPGSRVWEVSIDGTVISTHHFKEALAVPPKKIYFLNSASQNTETNNSMLNGSCIITEQINSNFAEQSFNFQKLYILLSKFLFTFKSDGIYLFDPQKAVVILWNNEITNIIDVACVDDVIYVWSGCGKMYALNLLPLEKFMIRLYFQNKYLELGKVCLEFENYLLNQADSLSMLHVLQDFDEKLKSVANAKKLSDRLKPLTTKFTEIAKNRKIQNAQKLKSGIYVVNNKEQMVLSDRRLGKQMLLRPSYLNLKGRSLSVSPERLQGREEKHHGSTSSLPDLVKEEDINNASKIVVNGDKENTSKVSQPEVNTENVVKVCQAIKSSSKFSQDLVLDLFDQILELSNGNKLESHSNLDLVQSLPLRLHFNPEDIDLVTDLFHSSLKSGLIFEWLSKFSGVWLDEAVKLYPEFLIKNHSTQSLEVDYKLSKAIHLFSNILKEDEIVDLLKKSGIDCYYASLQRILDAYQDSSLSSVSLSNLDLANVPSTPKILNVVYFLLNVGQVEACAKNSQKISLTDVFYLVLKLEDDLKKSGKLSDISELQSHTLFLSYLEKSTEKSKLILNCCDIIENYTINCLESINSAASCATKAKCGCGFPYPGRQPSVTMFPDVGHTLVDKVWPKNQKKCLEICGRVPSLWRYLISKRRNEPLDSVLPLLMQSGEIQELENRYSEVSLNVLETCFRYLIQLKRGNCLNCGEKLEIENEAVSVTDFGMLCTKITSPKDTLLLLQKYASEISSRDLSQTLFQGLIFSCIMENQRKGLRANVVDLLTGRGSQESSKVPVLSEKLQKEIFGEKLVSPLNESSFHHWGVKVNFKSNCTVCCLPLDTKVLISEAGLVVFSCSHAFHSACLRKIDIECPLCKMPRQTEAEPKLRTRIELKDVSE